MADATLAAVAEDSEAEVVALLVIWDVRQLQHHVRHLLQLLVLQPLVHLHQDELCVVLQLLVLHQRHVLLLLLLAVAVATLAVAETRDLVFCNVYVNVDAKELLLVPNDCAVQVEVHAVAAQAVAAVAMLDAQLQSVATAVAVVRRRLM